MPTYTYRCALHGDSDIYLTFAEHDSGWRWCGDCLTEGRDTAVEQVFTTPRIQRSSLRREAYFDHSLGAVVSTQQEREELAKKVGDKEGRHIVFADPTDPSGVGVTDEGLDATRRQKRDTGQTEGTSKVL